MEEDDDDDDDNSKLFRMTISLHREKRTVI